MDKKWENKPPAINDSGELQYQAYWNTGNMLILREALDHDHPEQLYNHLKSNGIKPEDYGVKFPLDELAEQEYGGMSKEQLIGELVKAKRELDACYRAGY